jgi:hypothetical protein
MSFLIPVVSTATESRSHALSDVDTVKMSRYILPNGDEQRRITQLSSVRTTCMHVQQIPTKGRHGSGGRNHGATTSLTVRCTVQSGIYEHDDVTTKTAQIN